MTDNIVIIGGGLAGARAAEALRDQGYEGRLTLVGAEMHLPYDRPPLSKGYFAGDEDRDSLVLQTEQWFTDSRIDLRLGVAATRIDLDAHEVELDDGGRLPYERLLLATGSTARTLTLDGADAEGVLTLRSVDDSDRIRAAVESAQRLVIIGGGWIGLELASGACKRGVEVTVIEAAPLPLLAALGPELSAMFLELHRSHGVTFRLDAQVKEIAVNEGRATGVVLGDGDGTVVSADVIVVGVGARPNLELAESAGLDVDNGVLVDETLRTSDPDIWAVGDIAEHQHPVLGQRIRVEHWANAYNQPLAAVASMLGVPTPYTELPFFWTDQHDLGMEYVGYAPTYDRIVTRGDLAAREFIAFWLDAEDRVLAGMNVNVWDVVDDVKALILSAQPVDPDRLADPAVALTDLVT